MGCGASAPQEQGGALKELGALPPIAPAPPIGTIPLPAEFLRKEPAHERTQGGERSLADHGALLQHP
jgi:hypothetical protein